MRTAAARLGIGERRFDRGSPRLSLQLPDGSRLFAVMAVAARPCLSIRRHRYMKITPDDLVGMGTIDLGAPRVPPVRDAGPQVVHHLRRHRGRQDDPAAGRGRGHPTLRAAGHHRGLPRAGPRPLPRAAPRRRSPSRPASRTSKARAGSAWPSWCAGRCACHPDRVIVGEARGEEVLALLNAMSQGTDGSMATLHASSVARGVLQAGHLRRPGSRTPPARGHQPAGGQRRALRRLSWPRTAERRFVSSVREVVDAEGPMVVSNEVFRPGPDGRAVPGVPPAQRHPRRARRGRFRPGLLERRPQGGGRRDRLGRLAAARASASVWCRSSRPACAASKLPRQTRASTASEGRAVTPASRSWPSARRSGRGGHRLAGRRRSWPRWPAGVPRRCWPSAKSAKRRPSPGSRRWRGGPRCCATPWPAPPDSNRPSSATAPWRRCRSGPRWPRWPLRLEGERLAPALRAFADDVADPTCDLVVAALVLAAEHQAQPTRRAARHPGPSGPGPGHHAPAGRGRSGRGPAPRSG